jgi:hypothetical protein
MAGKKRRAKKKPAEEFTDLSIRVDRHGVRARASINHSLYDPDTGFNLDESDDPVFEFDTYLTVTGTAIWPENRAGHIYEVDDLRWRCPVPIAHSQAKRLSSSRRTRSPTVPYVSGQEPARVQSTARSRDGSRRSGPRSAGLPG